MTGPTPSTSRALSHLSLPFEGEEVRIAWHPDGPMFVLKDIVAILGVKRTTSVTSRLDADEKDVVSIDTPGGPQDVTVVTESGLYVAIMTSRKPRARAFRRWVTGTVLPEIRRTGSYGRPQPTELSTSVLPEIRDSVAELREIADSSSFEAVRTALMRFDRHQDSLAETIGELNNLTAMILPETQDTIRSPRAQLDEAADGLQPLPPAAFSYAHVDRRPVALLCRPDAVEGFSDPMMQAAAMAKAWEEGLPLFVLMDGVDDARRASWDGWAAGRADVHVKYGVGARLAVGIGRYRRHPSTGRLTPSAPRARPGEASASD